MFDMKMLAKIIYGAAGAAAGGGTASVAANPVAPWQTHAAAGGAAMLAYLVGLWQQSPRPAKKK